MTDQPSLERRIQVTKRSRDDLERYRVRLQAVATSDAQRLELESVAAEIGRLNAELDTYWAEFYDDPANREIQGPAHRLPKDTD
jgi:hypothetical protein